MISGGKAPGSEPLKACLNSLQSILDSKENGAKLTSLECHDILCIISDAVLAGGIRRSALISLFSINDESMLTCKSLHRAEVDDVLGQVNGSYNVRVNIYREDVYYEQKTVWIPESDFNRLKNDNVLQWYYLYPYRARSNNSMVVARPLITDDLFRERWEIIKNSGSGEPGLYFTNNVELGSNPCCEISLNPNQFCNLTSVNVATITSQEDLEERSKAAAFLGTLQASYTDYHYLKSDWKKITEKEALLGVSLTGIASIDYTKYDFRKAAQSAVEENQRVAKNIGVNSAKRITCIKPEGSGSLVLGTSSGIHAWHNSFYNRRIRVGKNEAIYQYLVNTNPDVVEDEVFGNNAVITIPVKAPENAVVRSESVDNFLDRIKYFTENWVQPGHNYGMNTHNVSATVSIKDSEWDDVADWIWDNQDSFNGLSFLPYDSGTYTQAPFEDITEEDYLKGVENLKKIDLKEVLEIEDNTDLQGEMACSGGSCEIV